VGEVFGRGEDNLPPVEVPGVEVDTTGVRSICCGFFKLVGEKLDFRENSRVHKFPENKENPKEPFPNVAIVVSVRKGNGIALPFNVPKAFGQAREKVHEHLGVFVERGDEKLYRLRRSYFAHSRHHFHYT